MILNPPENWLRNRQDAIAWCRSQNVAPVPCVWGTKRAIREMTSYGLKGCGSYLTDHPTRRAAIDQIWKTCTSPRQLMNISLVTGWDNICAIDCDSLRTMKLAGTLIDAPKITSKKGGKFILRLIGDAPPLVQYKIPNKIPGQKPAPAELEFFSSGKHVLIYGKHPDNDEETGKPIPYRLYPKDIPELTWEQIQNILIRIANQTGLTEEKSRKSSQKRVQSDVISKAYSHGAGQSISDWFNLPYPQPVNGTPRGDDNVQGAHPVHSSTTGNNFSVDMKNGLWHCWRHASGGDRLLWYLIENRIIECEQATGGWKGLTKSQQQAALYLLKTNYPERYAEYQVKFSKTDFTEESEDVAKASIETLPQTLPDHHITVLNGLARIGKSRFGLKCLLDAGQGLYIANTHAILENSMKMMQELWAEENVIDKTAVSVVGKTYSCNDEQRRGRCNGCPKTPKNPTDEEKPGISALTLKTIAIDLLQKNKILTMDNIPPEYCPYHIMIRAHETADFVFLVPFFSTVDDELRKVRGRGLCVIDEGSTCDHYRTPCAEIATYQRFRHGGGLVTPLWADTHEKWFAVLKEYVEHRGDDKEGKPSPRKMGPVDSCIVSILEKLMTVYSILIQFNLSPTPGGMKKATDELKKINFSNAYSKEFKLHVLRKVEEYSKEAGVNSNEMDTLFVIALFPGEETFSWQGDNPTKLFFISDNSLYVLPDFEKLLVIGASQGEKFVKELARERKITDISKIYVTGFPFSENYLFIKLFGVAEEKIKAVKEKNPDVEIDPLRSQRAQFRKFMRTLITRNSNMTSRYPALVIVASKDKQEALHKRLQCGSSLITNHRVEDVWRDIYLPGNIGIYTQNSCISRGIDVQFFDRVLFHPGGFATPAQTARIQYLTRKMQEMQRESPKEGKTLVDTEDIKEEILDLEKEIEDIQTDEITNNVLRSAPIPSDLTSIARLKVVVMCNNDYYKLDRRIRNLTKSISFNDEEDPDLLLNAIDSIHHPVTPTDLNLDRPSPIPLKKLDLEVPLPLPEQRRRIIRYMDYRVSCIDRNKIPYQKVINEAVHHPGLIKSKRMTKKALIKYLLIRMGTHITKKVIEDCIILGLSDRLLLDEHDEGVGYYRLHPNVVAYIEGRALKGPDYPSSLEIIHRKNV